jgi:hypothetical protein
VVIFGFLVISLVIDFILFCRTDRVTEAFIRVLDDTGNNGKAMVVTPNVMDYNAFIDPHL